MKQVKATEPTYICASDFIDLWITQSPETRVIDHEWAKKGFHSLVIDGTTYVLDYEMRKISDLAQKSGGK